MLLPLLWYSIRTFLGLRHLARWGSLFAFCMSISYFRYFFVVLLSTVVNWQLGPMPKFSGMSSSSPKETVKVETNIEAPSTLYSIIAVYQSESEANKPRTIHLKKPVETWFHADGSLAAEAIYKDLLLLASPGK
ncbi:hypothetical protein DI09_33p190 [Mitosporidium daphniae]|uniref:Signal peptidase complex subunit 2 n=1 Tax=Mitosporidium daphniae TaxID=1485682 RepID=A0A098VR47_9MICR|nr:uncharacterized protein DI09_33p190 [Mitosporidium daphniae]KGG51502.1 hypothetical protein DI09_33p190 [Mitosporidium daphniae]|eukprot:XP_013237929.1 uncharacterized protein DI09_33p190 [Mitosporidium daphniae]